jgi:hypothetical protein
MYGRCHRADSSNSNSSSYCRSLINCYRVAKTRGTSQAYGARPDRSKGSSGIGRLQMYVGASADRIIQNNNAFTKRMLSRQMDGTAETYTYCSMLEVDGA